jgi:hypothetical protein
MRKNIWVEKNSSSAAPRSSTIVYESMILELNFSIKISSMSQKFITIVEKRQTSKKLHNFNKYKSKILLLKNPTHKEVKPCKDLIFNHIRLGLIVASQQKQDKK